MVRIAATLILMSLFGGLELMAQAPKKVAPPMPASSLRATSPPAPGQTLNAAQQQAMQSLIQQHQRIRARFLASDAADLDRLTVQVRQTLFGAPLTGNLLTTATQVVSRTVSGLSTDEASALAEYVLGGIAALPSSGSGGLAGAASAPGGNSTGAATVGGGQSALLAATKQMQETQMSFNLQYLQLQSQMQNENRSYTAVSNIMKTKHDTVKNSISNIR
jgi:hypothetical protein